MKTYIDGFDKESAFLAVVEMMEIGGDNAIIDRMRREGYKALVERYEGEVTVEWVLLLVLRARRDVRKSGSE